MSEEITAEGPKVTVGFERSVKIRDYETAKASVFIQVPTSPGDNLDTIVDNLKPTFAAAKSTVFEQLGIPFEVDPTELVVFELLEKHLGAVEVDVVSEVAATAPANVTTEHKPASGGTPAPTTKDGLWAELEANPKRWFDNREDKKSANGPDFKRKYTKEGLWLEYKGASVVPEGVTVPSPAAFK